MGQKVDGKRQEMEVHLRIRMHQQFEEYWDIRQVSIINLNISSFEHLYA